METRIVNPDVVPSLSSTISAFMDLLSSGRIFPDLLRTLMRTFVGLVLGVVTGLIMGISFGMSKRFRLALEPVISLLYPLPKPAIIPLTMIWWGIGDLSKIVVVIIGVILPMVINTYHGIQAIDQTTIWSAESMGTSKTELLRKIILPAALPSISNGIRISLNFSFVIIIANELIASHMGLGNLILTFGDSGVYSYMFAVILYAVIIAFGLDQLYVKLEKRILHWYQEVD